MSCPFAGPWKPYKRSWIKSVVTVGLREMSYLQVPSNSCKSVQLDVISESPPLLGSPYSCGIWSPLRSRLPSPSTVSITSSEGNSSEQDQLLIVPELKRINEDKVFLDIYYGFRGLQCRLDVLLDDVRKMKIEAQSLSHSFEKLLTNADRKFRALSQTRTDIADKVYLDQLISLLNGDLEHLPLSKWPFKITRTEGEKFDLVI